MKKIVTLIALSVGVAASSFAQGTVYFSNTGGSKISVNSVAGGPATGLASATGGSYYYALFGSTSETSVGGSTAPVVGEGTYAFNVTGWTFEASGTNSITSAGRFLSSSADANGATTLATIAGGNAATYYTIIGWSSSIGSTIASLQTYLANPSQAAWVGESAVGGPNPAGIPGSTAPATLFGASSPYIPGFTLGLVVPEPSTIALAALGGLSLLGLRRKKA
jgi:hypothetical protein